MNGQTVLKILRTIIFVSRIILFLCTAVFAGGIPYIWADAFFGTGWGIAAGLAVGVGAGLLANALLGKVLHWLMPDLREILRQNRSR